MSQVRKGIFYYMALLAVLETARFYLDPNAPSWSHALIGVLSIPFAGLSATLRHGGNVYALAERTRGMIYEFKEGILAASGVVRPSKDHARIFSMGTVCGKRVGPR